jgi:hypothetical protein
MRARAREQKAVPKVTFFHRAPLFWTPVLLNVSVSKNFISRDKKNTVIMH